jgi:hypothetical protein
MPSIHDFPQATSGDYGGCSIEKRKGMFGTVIISLPSKHEGGDMLFEYGA